MKKLLAISIALLCSISLIFAGGSSDKGSKSSSKSSSSKGVIYGIYKAGDQTWFIDEGEAARAVAVAAGYDFIYVDARMSPEEYLRALDNAVANNAAGIVTCTPDQTLSRAVVDKLSSANIPVVAADDALEEDGVKLAPWVGINAYVIGEANGQWIADYVNERGLASDPGAGLLIMTMDTVSSCVPRAEGEYDRFTSACPDFPTSRIFFADHDGTTDRGYTAADAVFTAHPEITTWLVTGANEEGTIGGLRALEQARKADNACVVGLGAYMAKDEWNANGSASAMKAAAYFPASAVGRGSVEVLLAMINGENVAMETAVDAVVVTPATYKEVMGQDAE